MNLETIQVLNQGKVSTIMLNRPDMLNAVNAVSYTHLTLPTIQPV